MKIEENNDEQDKETELLVDDADSPHKTKHTIIDINHVIPSRSGSRQQKSKPELTMEILKADPLKSPSKKGKKLLPMKSEVNNIMRGFTLQQSHPEDESDDIQSSLFEGLHVNDPT